MELSYGNRERDPWTASLFLDLRGSLVEEDGCENGSMGVGRSQCWKGEGPVLQIEISCYDKREKSVVFGIKKLHRVQDMCNDVNPLPQRLWSASK